MSDVAPNQEMRELGLGLWKGKCRVSGQCISPATQTPLKCGAETWSLSH